MKIISILVATALYAAINTASASPIELGGLPVAKSLIVAPSGVALSLQGAYVRTYYLQKTTSYALYATEPIRDFYSLRNAKSPVRMVVTVLMKHFTVEQFRKGWQDQFAAALNDSERTSLKPEIEKFLTAFETMAYGEQLAFDLLPGEGLRISLRGAHKLSIPNEAFAHALFSVWLGPQTVDKGLRQALLGKAN